jgi:hypothetical protein
MALRKDLWKYEFKSHLCSLPWASYIIYSQWLCPHSWNVDTRIVNAVELPGSPLGWAFTAPGSGSVGSRVAPEDLTSAYESCPAQGLAGSLAQPVFMSWCDDLIFCLKAGLSGGPRGWTEDSVMAASYQFLLPGPAAFLPQVLVLRALYTFNLMQISVSESQIPTQDTRCQGSVMAKWDHWCKCLV